MRRFRQSQRANSHAYHGLDGLPSSTPGGPSWNSIASESQAAPTSTSPRATGHTAPDLGLGADIYRPASSPPPIATPAPPPVRDSEWPEPPAADADPVRSEPEQRTASSHTHVVQLVDDWAARSLAGAFAADLLSWDEDRPEQWRQVIERYLPDVDTDALGIWAGTGRQRVDVVLPGLVLRQSSDQVRVEVRVRVTPYVSNPRAPRNPAALEEPAVHSSMVTATAPPPAAAGWRGCTARWARLMVPITYDINRGLTVDLAFASKEEPPQ